MGALYQDGGKQRVSKIRMRRRTRKPNIVLEALEDRVVLNGGGGDHWLPRSTASSAALQSDHLAGADVVGGEHHQLPGPADADAPGQLSQPTGRRPCTRRVDVLLHEQPDHLYAELTCNGHAERPGNDKTALTDLSGSSSQITQQVGQAFDTAINAIAQDFLSYTSGGGSTSPQDVLTYQYDQLTTGANTNETTLTPQNVGSSTSANCSASRSTARSTPSRSMSRA